MPSKGTDIHAGHRQRLKKRFLSEGLEKFEPHNVLELLLFFGIPRRDTNPVAHELLNTFGSFSAVLEAPYGELVKIKGMTESAAVLLCLCTDVARMYELDKQKDSNILDSAKAMIDFIKPYFTGKTAEEFYVIYMDNSCKVLACKKMFEGSITAAPINIRKIVENAITTNCVNVVIAHNHPQGTALPSKADICTTIDVYKALKHCDIRLLDHIIVTPKHCISLASNGYFDPKQLED